MAMGGGDNHVRVNRSLQIIPLPVPRDAFCVHQYPDDVWIEEGEIIAIAHDALSYSWDGAIHWDEKSRNYVLTEGVTSEIGHPFRWIHYIFRGYRGEVDNEPLEAEHLFWDRQSAEDHMAMVLSIRVQSQAG